MYGEYTINQEWEELGKFAAYPLVAKGDCYALPSVCVDSSLKPIPSSDWYFTDSPRTFEEQNHQPVENREKSPGRTGDGPSREVVERLKVAVRSEATAGWQRERRAIPVGETQGSYADALISSTEHASRTACALTGRANRQVVLGQRNGLS